MKFDKYCSEKKIFIHSFYKAYVIYRRLNDPKWAKGSLFRHRFKRSV